jgi:glycosyltransferase involved in cell wall biosynthesis
MFDLKEGRASAGDAAVYVPSNSGEQLGLAIARLLDDPSARERMGQLGQERVRTELSWAKSVAELEAAYRRALLRP